jgi:precorrin-6B methylase 1
MEKMKDDVDRALAILDEGLNYIGSKKSSILEQAACVMGKPRLLARAQTASTSPIILQSPSLQDKARHVGKRKKCPSS